MATSVKVHPIRRDTLPPANPFPQVIQTPSGLALLELQGIINLPDSTSSEVAAATQEVSIGKISFPDYHPETQEEGSTAWMKRVHMYVGQHQRLTGEVKKLPKAVAIIRKKAQEGAHAGTQAEELEIAEIVKYKLVFSQRPEPVSTK